MARHDRLTSLYEQVRRSILADIESGVLPEGSFLPAEPELCAVHGVSRITLRRAIAELCDEGRLIKQQGRGTVVAPRKVRQTLVTLSGFSEIMEGLGKSSSHRILSCRYDSVPLDLDEHLAFGEPVRFERVLAVDARPMTYEILWFDAARFPRVVEVVKNGGSFFTALRDLENIHPAGSERQFDVGFATREERDILGITSSQPVYRIDKTVLDGEGAALSFSRLLTPCHLVSFTLKS